jgi:hypothetical protein
MGGGKGETHVMVAQMTANVKSGLISGDTRHDGGCIAIWANAKGNCWGSVPSHVYGQAWARAQNTGATGGCFADGGSQRSCHHERPRVTHRHLKSPHASRTEKLCDKRWSRRVQPIQIWSRWTSALGRMANLLSVAASLPVTRTCNRKCCLPCHGDVR